MTISVEPFELPHTSTRIYCFQFIRSICSSVPHVRHVQFQSLLEMVVVDDREGVVTIRIDLIRVDFISSDAFDTFDSNPDSFTFLDLTCETIRYDVFEAANLESPVIWVVDLAVVDIERFNGGCLFGTYGKFRAGLPCSHYSRVHRYIVGEELVIVSRHLKTGR